MSLQRKIFIAFFSVGLLPALVLSISSLYVSTSSLESQAYNQLTSVRNIKKQQIESYFLDREKDIVMLAESVLLQLDLSNSSVIKSGAEQTAKYYESFAQRNGYYDVFIISKNGDVLYSAEKEADYGSNLNNGPYKDSNLGTLFRDVVASGEFSLTDFAPYAPSNGDPAAFIAYPLVSENGEVLAVVALQLSIDTINGIMQQRGGLGETGETYLVGSDKRMRSDSFLDPEGHSIKASFAGTIKDNVVDTVSLNKGLKGESGAEIVQDYNGNSVLSAFAPVNIKGVKWVLLAEIDEAEAMSPVHDLEWIVLAILSASIAAIIAIAFFTAKSIVRPLGGEPEEMQGITGKIAAGDLTHIFETNRKRGGVYGSMREMTYNLRQIMININKVTTKLSESTSKTSVTVKQANVSLANQRFSVENVSSAMTQMTATISQVASNARKVASSTVNVEKVSQQANLQVGKTISVIGALSSEINNAKQVIHEVESNSQEIGTIMEVIRGIADQTNLLALNAAIEAARAGDQGRGFAVVADEVRQLAQKTQTSTVDIKDMIELLQTGTQRAVVVMENSSSQAKQTVEAAEKTAEAISRSYDEIREISLNAQQIATASDEQFLAADEINNSLLTINMSAQENATSIQEIEETSAKLTSLSDNLQEITHQFKTS